MLLVVSLQMFCSYVRGIVSLVLVWLIACRGGNCVETFSSNNRSISTWPSPSLSAWRWTVESETDLSNCPQRGSIIIQRTHASPADLLCWCLHLSTVSLPLFAAVSLTLSLVSPLLIHLQFYVSFCASSSPVPPFLPRPETGCLSGKSLCHGGRSADESIC